MWEHVQNDWLQTIVPLEPASSSLRRSLRKYIVSISDSLAARRSGRHVAQAHPAGAGQIGLARPSKLADVAVLADARAKLDGPLDPGRGSWQTQLHQALPQHSLVPDAGPLPKIHELVQAARAGDAQQIFVQKRVPRLPAQRSREGREGFRGVLLAAQVGMRDKAARSTLPA